MKPSAPRIPPATESQTAAVTPLIDRLLSPEKSPFGVEQLPLIKADAPEFLALKITPHAQLLGLDPLTSPLAAVISLATPTQIAANFGSLDEALAAGNRLQHGAALLYGLQTSAIRYADAATAEALIRFSPRLKINFQFLPLLAEVIEPARFDAALLDLVSSWTPRDAMTWNLLEMHASWSEDLSQRVVAIVKAHGAEARMAIWTWHGNGYANNLHRSQISEAIEAVKPFAKTQSNAKRWITKLKQRSKSE